MKHNPYRIVEMFEEEIAEYAGSKFAVAVDNCTDALFLCCVYHKVSHLWDIPRYVLSLYSDYRIYLRHYTESIYETVMYFVPNRGSLELRGSFNTNDLS